VTDVAPERDPLPTGTPAFAVVGHPNKGKSSLVATLAMDDRVAVAPQAGTTTRSTAYPLRVDGRPLYTLVDTPGFQRARRVLARLNEQAERRGGSAADRPAVVAAFVNEPANADRFPDEVELLRPIVEGAGILYVVDGSVPYGSEYEAEMEVLRWTGRPSLAVINPIGPADYLRPWAAALGQYFRVVRVLNAVTAPWVKRLELLRAFGQLDERWTAQLDQAVAVLERDRERRRREAAVEVAELLTEAVTLSVTNKLPPDADAKPHMDPLLERYKGKLRRLEARARRKVEAVYEHHGLERQETEIELLDEDLFSRRAWLLFGLRRRDLIGAGAIGGAAAGGFVDASVGGASFLLGTAIGAAAGGALGWFGAGKLADVKIVNQPLGGVELRCGPTKNVNFPFVLLGRARLHHAVVAGRTHAQRGELRLGDDPAQAGAMNRLPDDTRKSLAKLFKQLHRASPTGEARRRTAEGLVDEIDALFEADATEKPRVNA